MSTSFYVSASSTNTKSNAVSNVQSLNPLTLEYNENGVNEFVTRLYLICIGREPDSKGLADWTEKLKNGKATGVSVAFGFIFSPEFQNKGYSNDKYVEIMYKAFFGRDSDPAGKADWLLKMNNGMSREDLFLGFANSNEFFKLCGSYGITAGCYIRGKDYNKVAQINLFVDRLYSIILGRSCDQSGMIDWSNKLASRKISGAEAAYGFVFSSEYRNKNKTDSEFLEDLYKAFMGRSSDSSGKSYWQSQLDSGKCDRDIFNGFVGSAEFSQICDSYGITRGNGLMSGEKSARANKAYIAPTNPTSKPSSNPYDNVSIPNQVLLDKNGIKITATGYTSKGYYGPQINLLVENDSNNDVIIQARDESVNGYMIDCSMSIEVGAGKKANDKLSISKSSLELSGITTISYIDLSFLVIDNETWDDIFKSDSIRINTTASSYNQPIDESGTCLYDKNGIRIIGKGIKNDISILGPSLIVYIYNNTDKDITVQVRSFSVNGYSISPVFSSDVGAHKRIVDDIVIPSSSLENNGITNINDIELYFHIFDQQTWDDILNTPTVNIYF